VSPPGERQQLTKDKKAAFLSLLASWLQFSPNVMKNRLHKHHSFLDVSAVLLLNAFAQDRRIDGQTDKAKSVVDLLQ